MQTQTEHFEAPLRASRLSAHDEALIILRVERGLSWRDIARVLGDGTADPAALRRRFEKLSARR